MSAPFFDDPVGAFIRSVLAGGWSIREAQAIAESVVLTIARGSEPAFGPSFVDPDTRTLYVNATVTNMAPCRFICASLTFGSNADILTTKP
jgi:hypothetical protein